MKKIFITFTIISILLLSLMSQDESNTIIIYTSAEQFRSDELQRQLNEKFPELSIRVMYTPTAKSASKISVEKDKTDADIVLALETSYMKNIEDSLADISGYSKQEYLPGLEPSMFNNKFVIWERFAGAIVSNSEVLKKHGLDVPKSYLDLLDPKYEGKVVMPDPKSSGTGYFFLLNLVNELGEDAAFDYFDKLQKNVKQFTESGSGPIKLMSQGEAAVGLAMTFQTVNSINSGLPLEIHYPKEGSPYSLTATGLIKGRESNPDIVRVFDFIINDFIHYDKEHFSPELIFKDQKITVPNYPQGIDYADMTGVDDMELKNRLLDKWKY